MNMTKFNRTEFVPIEELGKRGVKYLLLSMSVGVFVALFAVWYFK